MLSGLKFNIGTVPPRREDVMAAVRLSKRFVFAGKIGLFLIFSSVVGIFSSQSFMGWHNYPVAPFFVVVSVCALCFFIVVSLFKESVFIGFLDPIRDRRLIKSIEEKISSHDELKSYVDSVKDRPLTNIEATEVLEWVDRFETSVIKRSLRRSGMVRTN